MYKPERGSVSPSPSVPPGFSVLERRRGKGGVSGPEDFLVPTLFTPASSTDYGLLWTPTMGRSPVPTEGEG